MPKKVAVLIRDKEKQYEGLRFSLGLLLENHIVAMYVLNHEIEMTYEYQDNMGFIDQMGGFRYSNVPENIKLHGFKAVTLEQVARNLNTNELVIPF
jgi:hypothetical protein